MAFDTFDIWQRSGVKAIFRAVLVPGPCPPPLIWIKIDFQEMCFSNLIYLLKSNLFDKDTKETELSVCIIIF